MYFLSYYICINKHFKYLCGYNFAKNEGKTTIMKKLFLLDAYALIYRAYYGFISKPLVNSKGMNTSAIYGFTKTLQDVLAGQKMPGFDAPVVPDCIAVCFDPKGGTFRHKEFPTYKAQREAQPEDITIAVPWIKRIIEAYRIPIFEIENYEADDVVGTLSRLADETGEYDTFLMSPDKDYAQLVTERSRIFKPKSFGPGYEMLDVAAVLAKYELSNTAQVIDMLGLQGDTADNIPGCPGVGPKTAQKLIADFALAKEAASAIRNVRQSKNLSPKESLNVVIDKAFPAEMVSVLVRLANVEVREGEASASAVSFMLGTSKLSVELEGKINVGEEVAKLEADLAYQQKFLASVRAKLANTNFVAHAPEAVVAMERKKESDALERIAAIEASLKALK